MPFAPYARARLMSREELLAVYDGDGRRIGAKPRSLVHRDADWHELAFVWAVRALPGGRFVCLFQLRGRRDDRFFGHVDAPAGGHVADGETPIESAIRECEEEVGVLVEPHELLYLGRRRVESLSMDCKRSFQHHFLSLHPLSLDAVAPTDEVFGFVELEMDDFARLLDGEAGAANAQALTKAKAGIRSGTIGPDALARYSEQVKETFRVVLRAARHALETGEVDPRILSLE